MKDGLLPKGKSNVLINIFTTKVYISFGIKVISSLHKEIYYLKDLCVQSKHLPPPKPLKA